jgi:cation diffusion facilitator family transporter
VSKETGTAVVAAIVGNVLIAVTKLAAAAFSGSAAMFAEAIHSVVDTGNGCLMLLGLRRSRKPPDTEHPLGYGHELYFWTLIVGMLIFGLGGGISIVTGVFHIIHRTTAESSWWSYAVLAAAAVFETISLYFGVKEIRAERRGRGVIETIRRTKDPSAFAVVIEDTAALIGIALAFLGLFLSSRLQAPWIDGAFSIAIGALLCGVALIMVHESMGLLIGEGMERRSLGELRAIINGDAQVQRVAELLTLYLGPQEVLLAIELEMLPRTTVEEVRTALARIKDAIRRRFPQIRRIYVDTIGD